MVQCWPGLALQVAMVTGVSLEAESPRSAAQRVARYPDTTDPETGPAALITYAVSLRCRPRRRCG